MIRIGLEEEENELNDLREMNNKEITMLENELEEYKNNYVIEKKNIENKIKQKVKKMGIRMNLIN